MDVKEQQQTMHAMRRRSFVFRAVTAVAAGLGAGHLLGHQAHGAPPSQGTEKSITIHPHPDAVSRTTPRPPSHE
ncbi:MAG TPA: hypothetical protein VLT13_12420 [Bacteroidota bacterium]|nr:hypothetical protein [Bacteroidota bacterium]